MNTCRGAGGRRGQGSGSLSGQPWGFETEEEMSGFNGVVVF